MPRDRDEDVNAIDNVVTRAFVHPIMQSPLLSLRVARRLPTAVVCREPSFVDRVPI